MLSVSLAIFRRWLKWPLVALASAIGLALAAVIGTAALIDAGYLHEPLRKLLVARAHREIRSLGPVRTDLLSWSPSLTVEGVVIHNPPWMAAGILAEIGKVSIVFEMPTPTEPLRFRRIELQSATINLLRDVEGKANWRTTSARMGRRGPPLMGSLSIPDAQVHLRDARRHLTFDGKVAVSGVGAEGLRLDGVGELNTRPMTLAVMADPLATARRDRAYRFHFEAHSSGSTVAGQGALSRPFDMRELHSTFTASGEDLKDLFFLAGMNLPDTGAFRGSGNVQRSGLRFLFTDLQVKSGQSDIAGTMLVDSTRERTQVTADLHSVQMRRRDIGKRAAGREPARKVGNVLLTDTPLHLVALRSTDATFNYRASRVDVGTLKLNSLVAQVKVDHGVLTAAPFSARFADGGLTARWRFDGSKDLTATQLALAFDGLQLSQFGRRGRGPPPLDGLLRGRAQLAASGQSLRELAVSAEGTIAAIVPRGEIRASLAELGGFDFRTLGLALAGRKRMATLRCGVVALEAHGGQLTTTAFVVDTEPVLVTGAGTLDLASGVLDFEFRGHPKHVRLRLRASLVVHGTLAQSVVGLKARSLAAQAGAGVALGVLLTPFATLAAFVDPGRAKDADCAEVIAANGN